VSRVRRGVDLSPSGASNPTPARETCIGVERVVGTAGKVTLQSFQELLRT
jgi:hypothetical protein